MGWSVETPSLEGVRQWSIEQATELARATGRFASADDIIKDAGKIEAYVLGVDDGQ